MATDQEIRDAGFKYIPQQQYLLSPFEIPTAEEPVTNQGIVNTNAFANSGGNNFNIAGNMFGEGTAVKFKTRLYPNSSETTTSFTCDSTTTKKDVRVRARQIALEIANTTTSEDWKLGTFRLDIHPGGRR